MILRVGASKKRCKIDPKTQSQKALPKSSRKSAWGVDLGSILGGFWPQKCKKVEKIEDEILSRILEAKKLGRSTASAASARPLSRADWWGGSGGEAQVGSGRLRPRKGAGRIEPLRGEHARPFFFERA